MTSSQPKDASTAIQVKLNFRNFRAYRKVDIKKLYTKKKKLGEGAFGTVHEAWHIKADMPCAIKTISKTKLREHQIYSDLMWQELEALDKLEHPHIVRVLDLCEDDNNIYVVAELMRHGTLTQMLAKIQETRASFTERDCANIVY